MNSHAIVIKNRENAGIKGRVDVICAAMNTICRAGAGWDGGKYAISSENKLKVSSLSMPEKKPNRTQLSIVKSWTMATLLEVTK